MSKFVSIVAFTVDVIIIQLNYITIIIIIIIINYTTTTNIIMNYTPDGFLAVNRRPLNTDVEVRF
jgi:hypothetical protein